MALLLLLLMAAPPRDEVRTFTFVYEATVGPLPEGLGPIDIFLPVVQTTDEQEVLSYRIEARAVGGEARDVRFGNRFWHAHVERSDGKPITVAAVYRVRRFAHQNGDFARVTRNSYTPEEKAQYAEHLKPDRLAPLVSPVLDPISDAIAPGERSLPKIARAIYDYVIDNMEYKKVGVGWGNGDTHWACTARYGNCTDFHALFNSLARRRGIPARFQIGFPIPLERTEGEVKGYHCWVELYLPELGWVPIDAAEAKKHADRRDFYFGANLPDRIQLTVGRDVQLGPAHKSGPLNYFVYPHVEVNGQRFNQVTSRVSFREEP